MLDKLKKIKLSSVYLIPLSFLGAILIGTLLLVLPVSSASGTPAPFVDALFTATTSVCVTGLVTVDTYNYWSLFGHIVILVLIQIGGLGVITVVSTMILMTRKKFSLSERLLLRDALNLESLSDLLEFLAKLIRGTLIAELIGAILYMFAFIPRFGIIRGVWASVFTAVSAFCNAGIDILGPDSLAPYRNNPLVLFVTMILIITGGLGYVVWFDLYSKTKAGMKQSYSAAQIRKSYSEHTKLVLTLTFLLILLGACVIFAAEYNNPQSLGELSFPLKLLNSVFESVTLRTAGFAAFSQSALRDSSCLTAYFLMFIGGSPIGTAGGVKTTTFFLFVLNTVSYIKGKNSAHVYKRSVSSEQMMKATAIVQVSMGTILVLTMLLVSTNPVGIEDGLFEVVSACATVGLTRGVTPMLDTAGKLIITLAMYLGRIGPITMAIFLAGGKKEEPDVHYSEGDFIIG